jgi:soluble lytic murein transglycosylase-like protein
MRWWVGVVGGAVLASALLAAGHASADVYLYRDRFGVLHFTNAPTAERSQVLFRDYDPRPAAAWPHRSATLYDDTIRETATRYGVDYALVKAVIRAESAFDHRAISRKGALGLMQLMPETAALHRVESVFTPADNIAGGVKHLRMLLNRYGGNVPLALAAYNAGERAVERAGFRIPAYLETQEYVRRVLAYRLDYLREGSLLSARGFRRAD